MADEGKHENDGVDPAALLIAVFAVGAGPLLGSGAWTILPTVLSVVTLLVIAPFLYRGRRRLPAMSAAASVGFIVSIGVAWPIQSIRTTWTLYPTGEADGNLTAAALVVGLIIGTCYGIVLWLWQRRSGTRTT